MKKKTTQVSIEVREFTLREVRDALSDLSHGGHPDYFIPSNAKVSLTKRGRIRLEWKA